MSNTKNCIPINYIARGSSKDLVFSVTDEEGVAIPNLSTASDIVFMLKESPKDEDVNAKLSLSLVLNPTQVLRDDPNTGDITVKLTSVNTTLPARDYTPVINVVYSDPDDIQKTWFFDDKSNLIDTLKIVNIG